ncbi:MAG: hypothetical protein KIT11_07545 [Fimbriimonadaceae bacterium]|nr:hypothetical protein [Fimbriimonadaceae bacterium]QYK56206.1 MAG: hypothetical protein KF733_01735 [Fimbriimonadaceae bacterium]
MSTKLEPAAFKKKLDDLLAIYEQADNWGRQDASKRLQASLRRLHYLEVTRATVTTKTDPMIEMRGRFMVSRRVIDLVLIDLQTVWNDTTAGDEEAYHCFVITEDGFGARFASVQGRTHSTISLVVTAVR